MPILQQNAVSFSGSMHSSGGATRVLLYGWSTNPLVEYYVMEDYNGSTPGSGVYKGQITSDGDTYKIYERLQVNHPPALRLSEGFPHLCESDHNPRHPAASSEPTCPSPRRSSGCYSAVHCGKGISVQNQPSGS